MTRRAQANIYERRSFDMVFLPQLLMMRACASNRGSAVPTTTAGPAIECRQ
jgi:hypothetical protein